MLSSACTLNGSYWEDQELIEKSKCLPGVQTAHGCTVQSEDFLKDLMCISHPQYQLFHSASPVLFICITCYCGHIQWIQFGHTVTVHVQHRWQMNMNKLLHTGKHVRLTMDTYSMFNRADVSMPNGFFYGYWTTVHTDTAFTPAGMGEHLVKQSKLLAFS